MPRKFLLCFHDFSVWNFQKVAPILEDLKDLIGAPFSVLVIPDTEKASPETVRQFRETLFRLQSEGFELALHGYMGIIGMNLTHGEAEFAGLSEYESSRLLQQGLSAWKSLLEKKPEAFIPPTWYSNKYLPGQVRALGLLYEDRFSITSATGRRYASAVTSFAGIPDFLLKPAFKFGEFILQLPIGLPRIALHPVDFPERESSVRNLLRTALGSGRRLAFYRDL